MCSRLKMKSKRMKKDYRSLHRRRVRCQVVHSSTAVKHEFVEFSPELRVFGSQLVLDVKLVEEVEQNSTRIKHYNISMDKGGYLSIWIFGKKLWRLESPKS